MTSAGRADVIAGRLIAAPHSERGDLWDEARTLPASELAWALKQRCFAVWTTDPPSTVVAADLLGQLAASHASREIDALTAWTRGIALLSQGQMEAALAAIDRAGDAFLALGRPNEHAQTCVSRLMALAMLGRYDEATACGAQAREVFDAAGDAREAGKIELNLGNLAARRDHRDEAARHFTDARARFAAAGDSELEVAALVGLAELLVRRHDFESAEALYLQASGSAERGGFALLSASIERDVGTMEMRRGRYDVALRCLERSRRGYQKLQLPHYLAVAEEGLADAYLELNLLPEALALYDRSLATYEAAGLVTDRAWALSQRGRALTLLGRLDAAAASLAQAESAFAEEGNATAAALVQLWLAELAQRRRDWHGAVRHASAAEAPLLAARQMSWYLHARVLHAEALRGAGERADAEQMAHDTCSAAEALTLPQPARRARVLLGLLARERGDAGEARRSFEAAVASIESQRGTLPGEEFRAAFLGDNLRPYNEMVRLSLDSGTPETVLQWAERARSRSLADAIDDGGGRDDDGADPARREVARLRLRLDDRYRQLSRPDTGNDDAARLLDDARRLEADLLEADRRSALSGAPKRHADGTPALDLAALHRALGEDSALVEYFSLDGALHACVVAGGEVTALPLPARHDDVRSGIEQLRFQTDTLRHGAARLAHRLPELRARALRHLQALHGALWAPLLPHIEDRRVVVVPHGALHYLPFEALHDGRRHEVEARELCRAPSAALLLRCMGRPHTRFESALVLGHADERLPHVRAEVEAVAARFAGARALHGDAARGEALRAADAAADVVHIACHAQFRNDSPRFSALHLADGLLTVRDAARLQLPCGLVTLSACETGVSAVMPGDELIGLTHAFISAGAARVLASLWTVRDDATASFMQRFYDRLRAGERPAQALRATQVQTLHTHPHPYFWAAFTLHGGW